MIVEMKVPSPGESITEVVIAQWLVNDGDYVQKDQPIAEIDSDKATLELTAETAGTISRKVANGETVAVGGICCNINTEGKPKITESSATSKPEVKSQPSTAENPIQESTAEQVKSTPLAKEIIVQNSVDTSKIKGSGNNGKITKTDVLTFMSKGISTEKHPVNSLEREVYRQKMTTLRKKIAERLVSVKNNTAMLTTFNEVDMSAVMELRNKYKDQFKEKYGNNLGFMSFFTKACTEALQLFPTVNSMIDGDNIVSYNYADVGIAVSTPKGLMVPVLRNADRMSLAEIEAEIKRLAIKARDGKITPEDMSGGTFTITNGGVFGSMLSTPIINPPQSAILGMHNVVDRPVAVNGKVEIRPIMYVALSYDHRIIDGKESVSFLYKVKEMIENPIKLIFGSKEPAEVLLGL